MIKILRNSYFDLCISLKKGNAMMEKNENSNRQTMETKRLYRSKIDRILGGVCGGFAEYFNIDVVIVRVLCLIIFLLNGMGLLFYLLCLVVMKDNPEQSIENAKKPQNTGLYWGVGLIILGLSLMSSRWHWDIWPFHHWDWFDFWRFDWDRFWPVVIIIIGVFYLLYTLQQNQSGSAAETGGRQLFRSRQDKVIGGVCGGLAKNLRLDPVLVRIGWVFLSLVTKTFLGIIVYVLWMIFIPEEPVAIEDKPQSSEQASQPTKKTPRRVKKLPMKPESDETK